MYLFQFFVLGFPWTRKFFIIIMRRKNKVFHAGTFILKHGYFLPFDYVSQLSRISVLLLYVLLYNISTESSTDLQVVPHSFFSFLFYHRTRIVESKRQRFMVASDEGERTPGKCRGTSAVFSFSSTRYE